MVLEEPVKVVVPEVCVKRPPALLVKSPATVNIGGASNAPSRMTVKSVVDAVVVAACFPVTVSALNALVPVKLPEILFVEVPAKYTVPLFALNTPLFR